jgi:hypothetical protein
MRFQITLNMPSHQGKSVHQITADFACDSLQQFCDALRENDFIVVREFYRLRDERTGLDTLHDKGEIIINCMHVGKVKASAEQQS